MNILESPTASVMFVILALRNTWLHATKASPTSVTLGFRVSSSPETRTHFASVGLQAVGREAACLTLTDEACCHHGGLETEGN